MIRLSVLFFFFASFHIFADSTDPDPADLFRKIWSPYCKGVSLLECPSSQAEDLRKEIRTRMSAGESSDAILSDINQKFGSALRMDPDQGGRESLAYWIPWLVFGLAAIGVGLFWRLRSGKTAVVIKPRHVSTAQDSKILEDLKTRL